MLFHNLISFSTFYFNLKYHTITFSTYYTLIIFTSYTMTFSIFIYFWYSLLIFIIFWHTIHWLFITLFLWISYKPSFHWDVFVLCVCVQQAKLRLRIIKWASWVWVWTVPLLWPASGSWWCSAWSCWSPPSYWATSTGSQKRDLKSPYPQWS